VGYLVATTGRLLLPQGVERQALTVAEHRMAGRDGWLDADRLAGVDTLAELAAYAGVTLTRQGDWLMVATDHRGDPKWSDQAEEFYRSLAGFVGQGEVHLRGEDGSTWSYTYTPTGLQEQGSPTPLSTEAGAAGRSPATEQRPDPPPAPTPPPAPPAEEPGGFSYPGKEQRPVAPRSPRPPSAPPPGAQDAGWAGVDDDPPPAPPGRVVLMSVVLVVGVALIIGLGLLVAGF
jgi:hypothetical protein